MSQTAGNQNLIPAVLDCSLSGSQTSDGHTEGAAGHVVQTDLVAELHGSGIAAVLTADTEVNIGVGLAAQLSSHSHQLANAGLIQTSEGIVLVDLTIIVSIQELACVIAGEAEGHLSQVVGTEGEECSFLSDLVSGQSCAGDLDHGTDMVLHVAASLSDQLVSGLDDNVLDVLELLDVADQGDHDLGNHVPVGMLSLHVQRSLDDSAGLHSSDLGIGDSQTAAAVTHHGVELVQTLNDCLDISNGLALGSSQCFDVLFLGGNELVQRGIQVTDGDGAAFHCLVDALEVTLLHGLELSQSLLALLDGVGADHLADCSDTVTLEEHVLGTAQADAFCAELDSLHEFNPMMGHRGCRLAVTYPEIAAMQTRAVIKAALNINAKHPDWNIVPEIMIPLVGEIKELQFVKKVVVETADALIAAAGSSMTYKVGTMIEIPRAALTADEIAKDAEFFSFGTNDLTQMTFGFSRDDAGKFLDAYYAGKIYESDPFARLDQNGVGKLVKMASELGRQTRPDIKLGICGEHGGDPSSVEFCHLTGLDYVSCSPFRVPIARLAAAQAAIANPRG